MTIDELHITDYEEAYALWSRTEGMGLSTADQRGPIERFLRRNPGLSTAARDDGLLVGTVMAGHDGRRGYLYHLAVDPAHRTRGVGRAVVARSLERLQAEGIERCLIFVFATNAAGQAYWRAVGWDERSDIRIYSKDLAEAG
jgi:ribosomal protein S18 acetylase RimI-like enzyme